MYFIQQSELTAPTISSIEIRWPGGQVQTLPDVKADQILRVREPE